MIPHSHMVNWWFFLHRERTSCLSCQDYFPLNCIDSENLSIIDLTTFSGGGGGGLCFWFMKKKNVFLCCLSRDSQFIKTLIAKIGSKVNIAFEKQKVIPTLVY